jgi:hypothetical protein
VQQQPQTQIVKRAPEAEDWREVYIRAMYALYLQCPGRETKDVTGAYHLGEIGETAPKNWTKATPYSLAIPKEDSNVTLEIEVTHDVQ